MGANRGLLAVHGRSAVHVYSMLDGSLAAQARFPVRPLQERVYGPPWNARIGALAWNGRGDRIIAATGLSPKEWAVVELVREDGPRVQLITNVAGCVQELVEGSLPLDVVSIQPRSAPTPTPTSTEAPTSTATASTTPTATSTTVFTIGLGEDPDLDALEAMASRPDYFYRAPDGEDLAAIYAAIAIEIPCPAEDFWGGR